MDKVEFGIKECSKCEYNLRCQECVYNKTDIFKLLAETKADTVRKMQEEIKRRCIEGGIYPAIVKSTIDQVAKEMLDECKK